MKKFIFGISTIKLAKNGFRFLSPKFVLTGVICAQLSAIKYFYPIQIIFYLIYLTHIYWTLTDTTAPDQSWPVNNDIEKVLHTP